MLVIRCDSFMYYKMARIIVTFLVTGLCYHLTVVLKNSSKNADLHFPYVVAVCKAFPNSTVAVCGGTLISLDWVLTSQNCEAGDKIEEGARRFVVASISNLLTVWENPTRMIKTWIKQSEYEKSAFSVVDDIALLHLDDDFITNLQIRPISLPAREILVNKDVSSEMTECVFIFWKKRIIGVSKEDEKIGTTSDEYKTYSVRVVVEAQLACEKYLEEKFLMGHGQLCATARSRIPTLHSGGPLVCSGVQFGLHSWHTLVNSDFVLVFTRIDLYDKYIGSVVPELDFVDEQSFNMLSKLPSLRKAGRHYSVATKHGIPNSFSICTCFIGICLIV